MRSWISLPMLRQMGREGPYTYLGSYGSYQQSLLGINSPLSVQEGFDINFEEGIPIWNYITSKIPIWKYFFKTKLKDYINWKFIISRPFKFWKLVVVRSFCFGLILSPPLAWIAKNGYFEWNISLFITFLSPFGKSIWVTIIPYLERQCGVMAKDK